MYLNYVLTSLMLNIATFTAIVVVVLASRTDWLQSCSRSASLSVDGNSQSLSCQRRARVVEGKHQTHQPHNTATFWPQVWQSWGHQHDCQNFKLTLLTDGDSSYKGIEWSSGRLLFYIHAIRVISVRDHTAHSLLSLSGCRWGLTIV